MVDLERLKRVDKDAGTDVLQVWLFDLPELSYLASIEIVRQQNLLTKLETAKECYARDLLLTVEGKTREQREAQVQKELEKNTAFLDLQVNIMEQTEKLETLKAQRKYYDDMFRVVKDELYFRKRMRELALNKEIKKEAAESFGGPIRQEN